MALEQKLNLKLEQRLVLTQELQLAIKLLQLTRADLELEVQAQLEENPALEDAVTDVIPEGKEGEDSTSEKEADPLEEWQDKINLEDYFRDQMETEMKYRGIQREIPEEAVQMDAWVSQSGTLVDHLLWQVQMAPFDEKESLLAETIVQNIRDTGYLDSDLEKMAEQVDASPEMAAQVISHLQHFDPVGVCARDLKECLLVQLDARELGDSLAARLIRDHLEWLDHPDYQQIAELLGDVTPQEVEMAVGVVLTLDPKPGLSYGGGNNRYIIPEVFVEPDGSEYRVRLNDERLPRLRISRRLQWLVSGGMKAKDPKAKRYIKDCIRSALQFMKSVDERQKTILKVSEILVQHQKDYLEKGEPFLKPLILRDVADRIGVHESTVSRVVKDKYMSTPRGTLSLKSFFASSLRGMNGKLISAASVKAHIRESVEKEDPQRPLSDETLRRRLEREMGVLMARRTVAKYREEMEIPSSAKRRIK